MKSKNLLDLLVKRSLALVRVLLASDRDLGDGRYEIELLLDLFKGLEYDAGKRPAIVSLRRSADGEGAFFLGMGEAET